MPSPDKICLNAFVLLVQKEKKAQSCSIIHEFQHYSALSKNRKIRMASGQRRKMDRLHIMEARLMTSLGSLVLLRLINSGLKQPPWLCNLHLKGQSGQISVLKYILYTTVMDTVGFLTWDLSQYLT